MAMLYDWLRKLNRRDPGVCSDLAAWCKSRSLKAPITFGIPRTIERSLPSTTEPEVHACFFQDQVVELKERRLFTIPNAKIVGPNGLIVLPDGQFLRDHITCDENYVRKAPIYFQRWNTGKRRTKEYWRGRYFTLTGQFCRFYYHWMHDALPQLHLVLESLPNDVRLVVPGPITDLHRKTLGCFGIGESRIASHSEFVEAEVEELLLAELPAITGFEDPEAVKWVQERISSLAGNTSDNVEMPSRIYISRNKAICRRVENEDELVSFLDKFGFTRVYCEDYSVSEQAAFFAAAKVIVAPHGAGLSNILFSKSACVVEIFPRGLERTHYWSLANSLGLEYSYVCGDLIDNTPHEPNVRVDIEQIEHALTLLGVSKSMQPTV